MERKERNAEGKTSSCHLHAKYQALFQLCFTKFSQKKYTYQMLLSSKRKKSFQKLFFESKLKNIPKGVRSTKCPVATVVMCYRSNLNFVPIE